MARAKTKQKKDKASKQIYVYFGSYGDVRIYKNTQEAFEDGVNVLHLYDLVKKQKLVVQLEDI
jgi:hypothetical protein